MLSHYNPTSLSESEIIINIDHEPNHSIQSEDRDDEEKTISTKPPTNTPTQEDTPAACCLRIKIARPVLYSLPIGAAITEAAEVAQSLFSAKNVNTSIITTSTLFAFLSSIGLTLEATKENLEATCEIIKHRKLPRTDEWPTLTRNEEAAAISFTFLPGLWSPASKAMQSYYFVNSLRGEYTIFQNVNQNVWVSLSAAVASLAGLSESLTNTVEMYKVTRKRIAGKYSKFSNTFSTFISPSIGGILGVTNAAQESIQSYIAIKTIFSVTSQTGKIAIAIPSFINIIPNFSFEGIYLINAMDEFFNYVAERKIEPVKILAFSASTAMAVYLAYTLRPLDVVFYKDVITDFGFVNSIIPEVVYETTSWVMFTQRSLQTIATLYEPMAGLINRAQNKFTLFTSHLKDKCCGDPIQEHADEEAASIPDALGQPRTHHNSEQDCYTDPDLTTDQTPLLISQENSLLQPSLFYNARQTISDAEDQDLDSEQESDHERRCCNIL